MPQLQSLRHITCLIGKPRYKSRLALAVMLSPMMSAFAADAIVEEILVLEQRRAYRGDFTAMETPQSIQVIDTVTMERAGVRDLSQALDLSASVARQNNFGGLWNSFAVRGFVGDENLPSNYLVNGFNAGRGFGGSRDISGIESVEVLKGPVAALFGRGEPGGAINLVTKRPTGVAAGQLRLSADQFDAYRADVDYATNWIEDTAALRFVGFYEDAGSFRDTVNTLRYGFSPSAFFRLGENTSLLYELEATRQEVPFDRGVVAIEGDLGRLPRSRFLGEPGDGNMKAEVLGHQFELRHDFNQDWDLLMGFNHRSTSLEGFSTEPELTGSRQLLNRDGRTLTRQRRHRDYDADYWVLRAEVAGRFDTGGLSHRMLLGMDTDSFKNDQVFMRYRAPTLGASPTPQQSYVLDVYEPVYGQFPLPAVSPLTDRLEVLKATGIYLQDQVNLTEALQVRFGLRYDDFSQRMDDRLAAAGLRQSDNRISPQFGLVYAISDAVAFYSSYGQGFRAIAGADFSGAGFRPNTSRSTEAGLKFELLGGDVFGTVALFHQTQDNILSGDPVNPGFSMTLGEARSQGLEVDLGGRLGEVDFMLSYAYVDAQTRNAMLDPNFGLQIPAGAALLNVPKQTFSGQLSQDFNLGSATLTAGGGVLYVGKRLGEVATDFMLPDYTLLRAFVSYRPSERITLVGEIDNLLNERYFTNSFSQLWIEPGMPQRARVSMVVNF